MNRTFRIQRSIAICGIVYIVVTLAGALLFGLLLREPQRHGFAQPVGAAIFVFSLLLLITLLGAYCVAAYCIERFSVTGSTIAIRSTFQDSQFERQAVEKLRWDGMRARLTFHVASRKTILDLRGFAREDRLAIIRITRDLIPEDRQEGWPLFCHKVALRLHDSLAPDPDIQLSPTQVHITRKRYDRAFAVVFPITLLLALAGFRSPFSRPLLAFPVLVISIWLLLRFSVPPGGMRQTRTRDVGRFFRAMAWVVPCMLIAVTLPHFLRLAGWTRSTAEWVGVVVLLPLFPWLFYTAYKMDRVRKLEDAAQSPESVRRWDEMIRARQSGSATGI